VPIRLVRAIVGLLACATVLTAHSCAVQDAARLRRDESFLQTLKVATALSLLLEGKQHVLGAHEDSMWTWVLCSMGQSATRRGEKILLRSNGGEFECDVEELLRLAWSLERVVFDGSRPAVVHAWVGMRAIAKYRCANGELPDRDRMKPAVELLWNGMTNWSPDPMTWDIDREACTLNMRTRSVILQVWLP